MNHCICSEEWVEMAAGLRLLDCPARVNNNLRGIISRWCRLELRKLSRKSGSFWRSRTWIKLLSKCRWTQVLTRGQTNLSGSCKKNNLWRVAQTVSSNEPRLSYASTRQGSKLVGRTAHVYSKILFQLKIWWMKRNHAVSSCVTRK